MRTACALVVLFFCVAVDVKAAPIFSDDDRARLVQFWNAPGRYQVGPPNDAGARGFWQVRLTPEASRWFLAYQRAVGSLPPPTVDATASAAGTAGWEDWVQSRLAYDRWLAGQTARIMNRAAGQLANPPQAPAQPVPGPIPPTLLAAAGNPPPLAAVASPLQFTITFEDGESIAYQDNVAMRPRFAYYRFPQGVEATGQSLRRMPPEQLDAIFNAAGMSPSEQRIARSVSLLEGDFEAVNTYDTGFISVGFIQFITGSDGTGSLLSVLARERREKPDDFRKDFHDYGIEVSPESILVVVDPATGAELTGADAVTKVIDDKRLIAVFERAGRHSNAFRVAQVEAAKAIYWPTDLPVSVVVGTQTLTGKVSDIIHSEAGIATLFDRKVNRGNIRPFEDVVANVMAEHHLNTLPDAAAYEKGIITAMKYRVDFLKNPDLGQPPEPPPAPAIPAPSNPVPVAPTNPVPTGPIGKPPPAAR